jgi:hypothetical protein
MDRRPRKKRGAVRACNTPQRNNGDELGIEGTLAKQFILRPVVLFRDLQEGNCKRL